ncbi:MAG: DUF3810 domain-containing protein [Ruminococcaceae bacterium]|nr:DUF3810 domain-containing protein [Oscillospiraceae bacterium]
MIFKRKRPEEDMAAEPIGEILDVPKKTLPLFAKIFYAVTLVSALLFVIFLLSESFSDFFNRYISSVVRALLAHLTSWIPFSLGEMILILMPLTVAFIVIYANKRYSDSWHNVFVFCGAVFSLLGLLFSVFTFGFASAYRGSTLDKKLRIERADVSAEELFETAKIVADKVNLESENIAYLENGFSIMPYGYREMNDRLLLAYDDACDEYKFLQRLDSKLKPVMLSELMSYTHITGVYSFYTGEANLNVAFPDYTLPFTAAHELAHQRGIAREDEANFVAYLVGIRSEDAYIRYSVYLNLYEYLASALYEASPELYYEVYGMLKPRVRGELAAYSAFYDKYRDSVASEVTGTVNNTFLELQGTEGTKSYGMVVDLAVAYYKTEN